MVLIASFFASFFPSLVLIHLLGHVIGGNEDEIYVFEAEKNIPINYRCHRGRGKNPFDRASLRAVKLFFGRESHSSTDDLPTCEPGIIKRERCLKLIFSDGNCLFRAISYCMFKTENYHWSVRETIVDHVVENWDAIYGVFIIGSGIYPISINDPETYKSYMISDRTWGAEVELEAATRAYDICLQIFDERDMSYYRKGDEKNTIFALHFSGKGNFGHYNVVEDVPVPCVATPKSLKVKNLLTKKRSKVNGRMKNLNSHEHLWHRRSPLMVEVGTSS